MPSLEREADRLRCLIDDADAIIVGIGSGMSSAAGFNHYNRAGMARAGMEDWQQAFGFKSLFDGFYHLYPSLEQQWAYYARYIDFMLREPASQPYLDLRSLIGHKDYFILSTNVDTQVEKTFPTERICNYQGSFAHLQCKQPCCDELFDASPYVERMLAGMAGFEIRSEDAPRCPHCGWQLAPWVRDDTFLQGTAWREGLGRYERFVRERSDGRVLFLELGVGEMTPGIITLPFWSMTAIMWLAIFGHGLRFRPNPPTMGREASRPGERGIESVEVDEEDVQPGVQDGRGAGRREGRQDAVAGGQRPRRGAVAGVRVARPAGRVRRRRVRQGPVGAREEAGGGGRAEGA